MDISLAWLNQYLSPGNVSADEADDLLTQAGLPIEERTTLPSGDVVLDVEVTSNRADCLSHLGCAREVAAMGNRGASSTRRALNHPAIAEPAPSGDVRDLLTLENTDHALCPLFTARVITGAKVGPSPAWLVERLEAVGQRSINNAVDVTNFITLELGNPCHVFDRKKLAGSRLVIRTAHAGEKLRTLDDKTHMLVEADLVVADAERPQSLAGVMGGGDSEVDESTTDIVFEMATWDPVTVRTQARRLGITTDAGYRFQRGVDPRTIDFAARRAIALLCELTGGNLAGGVLSEGTPLPEPTIIPVRPSRAKLIMGIDVPVDDAVALLKSLEIGVERAGDDDLRCTIPPHRSRDLTREIDLIEEIARGVGYDRIPIDDKVAVAVRTPQPERRALRELGSALTGMGFDETVTFSFTTPAHGELLLPDGLEAVAVDDERRGGEPTLRPSVLAGLLQCRRANQDARSAPPGTVRLFEIAEAFGQKDSRTVEHRRLALLADVPGSADSLKRTHDDTQAGLRVLRGAIDAAVRAMHGPEARAVIAPADPAHKGFDPAAHGEITLRVPGCNDTPIGSFGLISAEALRAFGLDLPQIAAELDLPALLAGFPPKSLARALPAFPGIERDLSLVVPESVRWAEVEALVAGLDLDRLEGSAFVGVYRGKQVGDGKKSVTFRMAFRDTERTLRHEEVDPQVDAVVARAKDRLGAELRA